MSVIRYERHQGGSTTKTSSEGGQGGRAGVLGGKYFHDISGKIPLNECYHVREASGRFDNENLP